MMDQAAALHVPLHLTCASNVNPTRSCAARPPRRTSRPPALVRRLLRQAVQAPREQLTEADVQSIARRIAREELHRA